MKWPEGAIRSQKNAQFLSWPGGERVLLKMPRARGIFSLLWKLKGNKSREELLMPPSGGTTEHEKVGPSRDRKGAVKPTCRVHPSLTVGARFSAIFTGEN